MRATLFKLWPVFASVALIQLANGIQSDLVGVRASLEHFPAWTLGPMLACYYVGNSTAPLVSRCIIARFGHGLAVAASAVLGGIVVLAHAFLIGPAIWAFFRFAIGFSFSLGYVGFESFINDHV